MGFGGRHFAAAQLKRFIDMNELDHVTVRAIPFGKASFHGTGQGIDYVRDAVPQLDTVQLDAHHGCEFLDSEAQLSNCRSAAHHMEGSALSPEAPRDLIQRIAHDL